MWRDGWEEDGGGVEVFEEGVWILELLMYGCGWTFSPRDFFLDADRLLANQALTALGSL